LYCGGCTNAYFDREAENLIGPLLLAAVEAGSIVVVGPVHDRGCRRVSIQ